MEAQVIDKKELQDKTMRGIGWSSAAKFFRQFIQLAFQILLARLLDPSDFGLLGMILVFSSLTDILKNLGLGQALVHKKVLESELLNAVFWVNIFVGILLLGIFQLAAPWIAAFYKAPALEDITRVYSLIFLIGSFNVVQDALLQKQLQFKRLFVAEAVAVLSGGFLALWLAWKGYGVWTLVWQYLVITLVSTLIIWFTSSWAPSFRFSLKPIGSLQQFGKNLLGHDLLSFVSRNIDNLLIGKFLGAASLGFYSRAYFLMLQPINLTNQVLARVMFPVFAKLQDQPEQIRMAYLKSTRLVSFLVFPAITFVFVMSDPLVRLLLGDKWAETGYLLKIFCVYSLVDTIGVTTGWIYKAIGRTDVMFKWAIYSTTIIVSAILIGLKWGVEGVAISYTVAFIVLLWLPGWYVCYRLIGLKLTDMLKNLAPVFFISLTAGAGMYAVYHYLSKDVPLWLSCMIVGTSGAIFYYLLALHWEKASLQFVLTQIRKVINRATKKKVRHA